MQRIMWIFAALSGAMAVVMGAASAHWLANSMDAAALARIDKAAAYQIYHSLALLAVVALHRQMPQRALRVAGLLFMLGVLCFSGSLYLYSFVPWRGLMLVTPLGGLSWIAAWLTLAVAGAKHAGKA